MDLIGKTLKQAQELLLSSGIIEIEIINNFKNPIPDSILLVTAFKINNKTAQITLGSFKLDL